MVVRMMQHTGRLVLLVVTVSHIAYAQIPVPVPEPAFVEGNTSALTRVSIFYDLLCSDCKQVHPTLQRVIQKHGGQARFDFHLFPLPYHHNAFLAARAAFAVASSSSKVELQNFVDVMFRDQDKFLNEETKDKTMDEVKDMLSTQAETIGVSSSIVRRALDDPDNDEETRLSWKLACTRKFRSHS